MRIACLSMAMAMAMAMAMSMSLVLGHGSAAAARSSSEPGTGAAVVTVDTGKVAGVAMADGSTIFYGVPYAAAPTGLRRWHPPVAASPWSGVRDATRPAPPCVQAETGWNQSLIARAREDCLTVSIRTPSLVNGTRLPVLVYIHGGSNAAGDAGGLAEDAIHRAGIVLVKIQYRLGVFGFLGLERLRRESPATGSGNYGLLDQIAALAWIKANIAAFGGDAGNVTISGNSAGGTDALFLTLSPLARGLFRRAILQAPAPGAPITAAQNEATGARLLDRLHLSHDGHGLASLRAMPFDRILKAARDLPTPAGVDPSFLWEQQILDGYVMARPYAQAYAAGGGRGIAVLIGSNRQELGADRNPDTANALITAGFGRYARRARALYGDADNTTSAARALFGAIPTQVVTDLWFRCPVTWLSEQMVANGNSVWRYEFGFGAPESGKPPEHTSEMTYVYRAVPAQAISTDWPPLQRYWINFIRTGSPDGVDLPHWPVVGRDGAYLGFDPGGIAVGYRLRKPICDLVYKDADYPRSSSLEVN